MNKLSTQSICGILLLLILLTFANALKNPFMLDDHGFFGINAKQPLWSFFVPNRNEALGLESPQMEKTYYRPLAHVIPLTCYRIFGAQPFGYHFVNTLFLWAAAVCVYFFIRNLRRLTSVRSWDDGDWNIFAFFSAALFALHPINSVLINYITASVFSAQVVFMLGGLYCLTLGNEGGRTKDEGRKTKGVENFISVFGFRSLVDFFSSHVSRPVSIGLLCFILALFCHETAVLLPLYAVLVLRLKYSWSDTIKRILPLLAVLAAYGIFRSYASPFSRSILYSFSILDLSLDQKAATVIKLLSWYFQKLFLPWDIFLMWSTPFVREAAWMWWVPALVFLSCAIGILLVRIPRHVITLLAAWFALGLTPIAAGAFVTPYLGGLIEPHWFVFGSIGFFAAVSFGLSYLFKGSARGFLVAVLIGSLMSLSLINNRLWSNEREYYEAWVKEAPYFKAVHYFLGLTLSREGRLDEAYDHLHKAVLGRYKDWMVYMELGLIDLRLNRLEKASENLRKAYTLEKNHSGLLNAVGALAFRLGKAEEAKNFWERSIRSNPYNLEPKMNLGMYYVRKKDPAKAAEIYQGILKQEPGFMPAQKALGRLQRQGT